LQENTVFLPLLAQVFLTLALYIYLAVAKAQASKDGLVDESRRGLHSDAWPPKVQQINNCIRNQFEVPVLFFVVVFVMWAIDAVNLHVEILAWFFVLSRVVHANIHTGSNDVPVRRKVFMLSSIIVLMLTVMAAITIVLR
jgi:hypothetical protein